MNKIFLILFFSVTILNAQEIKFRENINIDSLLTSSLQEFPEDYRESLLETYKTGNQAERDFLLFMISMPVSSKKELIDNYEKNKNKIEKVKTEYKKLVLNNYIVYIEFEPESKILTIPEQITLKIYKKKEDNKPSNENNEVQRGDNLEVIYENSKLTWGSEELKNAIESINWNNETLLKIKNLLDDANCISVKNGEITTIGFARSGMGMYFYKIFDEPLNSQQVNDYNGGCYYIYYKDNVVLEYGGGAIGRECFEKD